MTTHDSASTAETIEHRIGEHGRLDVTTASWDVEIVPSRDDHVRVRRANGGQLPRGIEVDRAPDSLSIRQPGRFGGSTAGGSRDVRLSIELPPMATAKVTTASGDVQANGLRGDVSFRSASGDLAVTDAAGTLSAETVSGDLTIGVAESLALTVKSVSGDLRVDGGRLERIAVTTTSGDVVLGNELGAGPHSIATLSGDAVIVSSAGVTVAARTVAGDLRSDLPHRSEGGPGRRSIVVGDGAVELQFKSVSGDLRVIGTADALGPLVDIPLSPAPPAPPAAPRASASPVRAVADPADAIGAPVPEVAQGGADDADPDTARLTILRALERGEIDIAEATSRLAELDGPSDD
jgi:DUF4097 and DUF4098 domain-containing protein YvlB